MTDHVNRAHALLSASGAERWLACTPSARLEDSFAETQSSYADEGRLAHEVAEIIVRKRFTLLKPSAYKKELKRLEADPLFHPEMILHAQTYADHISKTVHSMKEEPHIAFEKRVDYSNYVPEGFGTADCILVGGSKLYVIDYKYGKGVPVGAEDNSQMKLYALGALNAYSLLFPVFQISMSIVQPRLDSISECQLMLEDLLGWGETIKPLADRAFKGEGELTPGDHCRFCKAKAQCRARAEAHTALEDFGMMMPPLLSNAEIGELLVRGKNIAKWLSDLQEYALSACLQGAEIPGWKAVHGRSSRQFTDAESAFAIIKEAGWDESLLYERKPLTLAQVEKLLGKKTFSDLVLDHVESPPGKPTLVEESDKRDHVKPITAEADFKGNFEFGVNEDF